MSYRDLDPRTASAELQRDPTLRLLDVRTAGEHKSHRLPGSVLVPVQALATRVGELDAEANWLVYCEHGRRSLVACDILAHAGFKTLANLHGGITHWADCGLPVERGGAV